MEQFLISQKLLQDVVNILQELPYKSVYRVLDPIRQLKPEIEKKPKLKPNPDDLKK